MTYTQLALLGVAATIALDLWILRTRLLTRRVFWTAYAIVVGFQLLTNGVLTGLRIVRYDGAAIIGSDSPVFLGDGRIAYAPVEDLLFGFALVVQAMAWWVFFGRRGVQYQPVSGPPRWWLRGGALGTSGGAAGDPPAGPDGTTPGRGGDAQPS